MPGKRQLAEDGDALAAPQTTAALPRRTRRRSSPPASSLPNGDSPVVKHAVAATSAVQDDHTMAEARNPDSDSESSVVSSSSEEPSSDSDEDSEEDASDDEGDSPMDTDEITTLPRPPDAEARRRIYQRQIPQTSSLGDRLKAFLPQLAAANEELERDRAAGKLAKMSLENVGDNEEHYIEMNLGLGVLKERDPNRMDSDSDSEDEPDDEMDTNADGQDAQRAKEKDVLSKLMGRTKAQAGAGIQEVSDQ